MKMSMFEKNVHFKRFTFTGMAVVSLLVLSGCEFGKKKEKENFSTP